MTTTTDATTTTYRSRTALRPIGLVLIVLGVLAAGCGDDDDDVADEQATDETTTQATANVTEPTGAGVGANAELCQLATAIFEQDTVPTSEQLAQYSELAPEEIADAVAVAAPPLVEAGDDLVAFFVAVADDAVAGAVDEIDAFEESECGIPHSENETPLPDGASTEIEDDAARVDVSAIDYGFEIGEVSSGRTSFVLTNDGAEAHFLGISRLADGVTLDDLLASENSDGLTLGDWETGIAAPGGSDEEVITFDAEPGEYVLYCFLPGPDGTPHAFSGMAVPIIIP